MAKKCPPGYSWNAATKRCQRAGATPKSDKPKGGTKKDVAPKLPGKQVANPAGKGKGNPPGACPTGYVWDAATRKCVKRAGTTTKPKGNCPTGYKWDSFRGRCVRDKAAPTAKNCPPGSHWAEDVQRCVSGNPSAVDCGPGKVWDDAKGRCVRTDEAKHGCPEGSFWDADLGVCIEGEAPEEGPPVNCPAGTVWNGFMCVKDTGEEEPEADEGGLEFVGLTPDGTQEIWRDPVTGEITYKDTAAGAEAKNKKANDLFELYRDTLEQFGFDPAGLTSFLKEAVKEDWNASTFTIKMRQQDWYLANPLYAANIERSKKGGLFMSEAQVLAYADAFKTLAKNNGYTAPSDHYIASAIANGHSPKEFEHKLAIQKSVQEYGPAVRMVMENELGVVLGDQDLFEMFDDEINTEEWTTAYRNALYRGRPFALGLGVRSQAEADALRLLGVDPDEAFGRYSQVAQNASRFDRLATIEGDITGHLPQDFGAHLAKADNSLLVRALVFNDSAALAELQGMTAREIARFQTGGGAVSSQGQAIGLLSGAERASFG